MFVVKYGWHGRSTGKPPFIYKDINFYSVVLCDADIPSDILLQQTKDVFKDGIRQHPILSVFSIPYHTAYRLLKQTWNAYVSEESAGLVVREIGKCVYSYNYKYYLQLNSVYDTPPFAVIRQRYVDLPINNLQWNIHEIAKTQ